MIFNIGDLILCNIHHREVPIVAEVSHDGRGRETIMLPSIIYTVSRLWILHQGDSTSELLI